MYSSIFDGINLVIHEAGHLAFSYFGELLEIAGGTILQLMAPIVAAFAFYRQKDYFAVTGNLEKDRLIAGLLGKLGILSMAGALAMAERRPTP